jgi:hypothetical protein
MDLGQKDIDALFNSKRIAEVVSDNKLLVKHLEPLRTFRNFISESREKAGKHYVKLKDKEDQLITLHRQTVLKIKQTRVILKESIEFFEQRKSDYEAMIEIILKASRTGRVVSVPSFGSTALKKFVSIFK